MTTETMEYRAITQRQAEHIGNAASVIGGYVAVDGPRVVRMDGAEMRDLERGIAESNDDEQRAELRAEAARYHRLPGGSYVAIATSGEVEMWHIMRVPVDHPLADDGFRLPRSIVAELEQALASTGYAVAR